LTDPDRVRSFTSFALSALLAVLLACPASAHEDLASFDLSAYRGQVVYLDFWASWCAPCRESFPFMDALQREHRSRGLVVIAVNVDTEPRLAAEFLAETAVDFKVAYDPAGKLAERWNLEGMPTTVLIGRDGEPRSQRVGFRRADEKAVREAVLRLLAEEVP
jgi:thiol-disulfide isomerase/thioredoxin